MQERQRLLVAAQEKACQERMVRPEAQMSQADKPGTSERAGNIKPDGVGNFKVPTAPECVKTVEPNDDES